MTVSNTQKLLTLVQRIQKSTTSRDLVWRETSSDARFYATLGEIGGAEIEAFEVDSPEENSLTAFRFSLVNARGRDIDEIVSRDVAVEPEQLRELFEAARASARNADRFVDQALQTLGG